MPYVDHRPEANEYLFEALVLWTPIDHRAGHWSTLATVPPVYEKAQPGVVEKRDRSSSAEHVLFPVASIRSDRHKGEHFNTVLYVSLGAFSKPISNRGASLAVPAVWRIDEDGRVIHDADNPSISGRAYSTVAPTIEWRLEHGSSATDSAKNSRIALTYFGGVHQCWLSTSALLRPAVMSSHPRTSLLRVLSRTGTGRVFKSKNRRTCPLNTV